MNCKKPFLILLLAGVWCLPYAVRLDAQLIEPTRGLRGDAEESGILRVVSEPPGMEVRVDGNVIGKTPVFAAKFVSGAHLLRIGDSNTEVHLAAGKTTTISWFKGSFIEIPESAQTPREIVKEPQPSGKAPELEQGPTGAGKTYKSDPYYWPMNPRGPIY
ncbi:MAG: PEGA domain-containing protein [Deltaproteobacteria bacterium]|nr:PEGA domain-containing protein [Deltaproteobacteria bacterium]